MPTIIKFEGDNKTTMMNMVEYLLTHDGHLVVNRDNEAHTFEVYLTKRIADYFKDIPFKVKRGGD